jgi:hypothetical protein
MPVAEMLKNVGLSEDDFCYELNSDIYYHWSGFGVTLETLCFDRVENLKAEIDKHLSSLTDKEERLEKFNLYKKHYKFVCDLKSWLLDKIIEESGINNLTDFETKQEAYRTKRREYISGWEQGKSWNADDLTDDPIKIPAELKRKAIEAWDYVITYRNLLFLPGKIFIYGGSKNELD